MDSLVLPVLTEEHTIDKALERMTQTDSRAIVVRHFHWDDAPNMLYTNREVAGAWRDQEPTCAKLLNYGGEPVPVLDRFTMPAAVGSLEQLIERQLDELHSLLGVLFPPRPEDDLMMVVTRHELKRDQIALASLICGCSGPMRHVESSPPAASGDKCVVCDFVYTCW